MKNEDLLLLYVRLIGDWALYQKLSEEEREEYLNAVGNTLGFATFCASKALMEFIHAAKKSLKA